MGELRKCFRWPAASLGRFDGNCNVPRRYPCVRHVTRPIGQTIAFGRAVITIQAMRYRCGRPKVSSGTACSLLCTLSVPELQSRVGLAPLTSITVDHFVPTCLINYIPYSTSLLCNSLSLPEARCQLSVPSSTMSVPAMVVLDGRSIIAGRDLRTASNSSGVPAPSVVRTASIALHIYANMRKSFSIAVDQVTVRSAFDLRQVDGGRARRIQSNNTRR